MNNNDDVSKKLDILKQTTLSNFDKKFGDSSYFVGDKKITSVPILCSSGSLSLDLALGTCGFPVGRIIEIAGQESSGKSTLTLLNIAEIQRNGMVCAYIDVEQSFDPHYAQLLGVNVDQLVIVQPDCMEEAFEMLFDLLNSKVISYIVVDSTNAMIPRKMLEGDTDTALMGKSALLMSQQLPKVVSLAKQNNCTVTFISQIRSKIGVTWGSPEKIGVGEAMKFYASIRLKTSRNDIQKDDETGQTSVLITVQVIKNKVGVPFKKATFKLLTGENNEFGIDSMQEVIDLALKYDILKKAGSWYSYNDERLGQGIQKVKEFFKTNSEMYATIYNSVKQQIINELQKTYNYTYMSFNNVITSVPEQPNIEKPLKRKKMKLAEVSDSNKIEEEVN